MRQIDRTVAKAQPLVSSVNPIAEIDSEQVRTDLKAHLLKRYAGSYALVDMLLTSGMEAYGKLALLPDTPLNKEILTKLNARHYPGFSLILMLYESEIEAYDRLN